MSSTEIFINRNGWKSADLKLICALLNTNKGVIQYNYSKEEPLIYEHQQRLIQNKIKKISPNPEKNISVKAEEKADSYTIRVSIHTSSDIFCVTSRSGAQSYYYYDDGKRVKTDSDAIARLRRGQLTKNSLSKVSPVIMFPGAVFVETYKYKNGNEVPIFEAESVHGFNRIVGYSKYINRSFANVYSRGECILHSSLIPSLYRDKANLQAEDEKIGKIVDRFFKDATLSEKLSLSNLEKDISRYRIEGVLQHYGATTSFLDVVDNHWIALWMGLNQYTISGQIEKYARYIERRIPVIEKLCGEKEYVDPDKWKKLIYQYVILIAVPFALSPTSSGINISDSIIEIDLRKALPSIFLRPHAQHGLVIKKKCLNNPPHSDDYDLSSNVVAIIRVRIDRAKQWIGSGELLTQDNLIPPPGFDTGYELLLNKAEVFRNSSLKIMKYE